MKMEENNRKTNILKRITDYDDAKDREEYWRGEYERIEDNIIRRIIDLDVKFDKLNEKLDMLLAMKKCSKRCEKNRNKVIFNEKERNDKSIEKDKKVENKAKKAVKTKGEKVIKKRGRPKKNISEK